MTIYQKRSITKTSFSRLNGSLNPSVDTTKTFYNSNKIDINMNRNRHYNLVSDQEKGLHLRTSDII
ncbi:CLUMA_CG010146, isoform A [Clunio marinus]|uniref:CLUMA_CG010146, isoform A n=1 Tax=Clunio marinus TaxID=568069 RepID=A0A1J1I8S1_9DIPT|nr:CLUMA_CG010146, isoform A [Clunio marinus]